jgi:hypothetical protein
MNMRFSVLLLAARKLEKFNEEDKGIHAMDTLGSKQFAIMSMRRIDGTTVTVLLKWATVAGAPSTNPACTGCLL